ncbi:MAG: hypothetical protein CMM10_05440 [Rhodospirillaceae bacterium]|jgi:hypothetical protein|nr:hypothetical protein [Rhodospirillaceae bacterium]|tara:strand:+ start:1247 stop:1648 length:402 start_codon:yes stop_codon:yes gene_type:complete
MANSAILSDIERQFTGPIPSRERWILRFGGIDAYRLAKAKSVVRHMTDECLRMLEHWQRSQLSSKLTDDSQIQMFSADARNHWKTEFRRILKCRAEWKRFLNSLNDVAGKCMAGTLALFAPAALSGWMFFQPQ